MELDDRNPAPWEGVEVWGHVPELAELPPAEAGEIYFKLQRRIWRCPTFWLAMMGPGVAIVAGIVVSCVASARWYASQEPTEGARLLFVLWRSVTMLGAMVAGYLAIRRAMLMALGRMARGEVGTHCANCDYDLRATRDRSGPRLERCPECGRLVEGRVREYAVPGEE